MQLLQCCPVPNADFATLSLLMDITTDEHEVSFHQPFADFLTVVSPIATTSSSVATQALMELHEHLFALIKTSMSRKKHNNLRSDFQRRCNEEDASHFSEKSLDYYFPIHQSGLSLLFIMIRDRSMVQKCTAMFLSSSNISPVQHNSPVLGIVLCVGITGAPIQYASSPTLHALPNRIREYIDLLSRLKFPGNPQQIKDQRKYLGDILYSVILDDEQLKTNAAVDRENGSIHGAVGAVLDGALGKTKTPFMSFSRLKKNRVKQTHSNPISSAFSSTALISSAALSSDVTRIVAEQMEVLSFAEIDMMLQPFEKKLKPKSRKPKLDASLNGSDLNGFDYIYNQNQGTKEKEHSDGVEVAPPNIIPIIRGPREGKKKRRQPIPRGVCGHTQLDGKNNKQSISPVPVAKVSIQFNPFPTQESENSKKNITYNIEQAPSLVVNVVLDEKITCSFHQSRISSCSIKGRILVMAQSNSLEVVPFVLSVKDLSYHIQSIEENRMFVEKFSNENNNSRIFKYTINLSKLDDYLPILNYKCSKDLQPIPIRVQSKSLVQDDRCRVALQVSSNPENQKDLTDLTIVMSVPTSVIGKSLITHPKGGVWDESKRIVQWRVDELPSGDRFKLRIDFELVAKLEKHYEELSFPVSVRCQSIDAQLSNIQVNVSSIGNTTNSNIEMKLTPRFGVFHEENK